MMAISNGKNQLELSYSNLKAPFTSDKEFWYTLDAASLGLNSPFCPVDIQNFNKQEFEFFTFWVYSDCQDGGATIPQAYLISITVENRLRDEIPKITASKIVKTVPIQISCKNCKFQFCAALNDLTFYDNSQGQSFTLAVTQDGQ